MNRKHIAAWAGALLALPLSALAQPKLMLYCSFEKDDAPDFAAPGVARGQSENPVPVEGRYGRALRFAKGEGTLSASRYTFPKGFGPNGWTVACWMRPDEAGTARYAKGSRTLLRVNGGWGPGVAWACFDGWSRFCLDQLDAARRQAGAWTGAAAFPGKRWIHLALACDAAGHHRIFINGNEASYTKNVDVGKASAFTSLLLGSMDGKASPFDGAIDELKVLDGPVDAAGARALMEEIPGRTTADVDLHLPCDGEIAGKGVTTFGAVDLVFAQGVSHEGVKMVRHGYDRRAILNVSEIGVGRPAASVFTYFIPDWDGASDDRVHGLLAAAADGFAWDLAVRERTLAFTVTSGGRSAAASLPAACFAKGRKARVAAGYDFAANRIFVACDERIAEAKLDLPRPQKPVPARLVVGDVRGADTYSLTQAEGVLDEILVARECRSAADLAAAVETEIFKKGAREAATIVQTPVTPAEEKLWDLAPAERRSRPGREEITLNARWRCQLTDEKRPFDPKDWIYLNVPGRYSGQENGGAEAEFCLYGKDLKPMRIGAKYCGHDTFHYLNGWYERAFRADPAWKGREIVLKLTELSPSQSGRIFLNGRLLAKVPAGMFHEFPISEHVLSFDGWNYLTIATADSGGRWTWRGVKGDMSLEIRSPVHAVDPEVVTSVKRRRLDFGVTLVNGSGSDRTLVVEAEIAGPDAPATLVSGPLAVKAGADVRASLAAEWPNAHLWDIDSPTLYTCTVRVKDADGRTVDTLAPFRFGFREMEIRGRDFYLNGKKIHLFVHDEWYNRTSSAADARETAKLFKDLGYNCIRMTFGGQEALLDNTLAACDEVGLLHMVNARGVTGREYALWNDPATGRRLEDQMRRLVCHWRNHASTAIWYLSINFLGCAWDYHPLKIADGYEPAAEMQRYRTCLHAVDYLRKYDASRRPYFFQAGGNFGEIQTSNAYFCWWPQAERDAWPEEWSKRATKPMIPIETSFPYFRSFLGMDLFAKGHRPLFFWENLARYYGPSVYLEPDSDMQAEVRRSDAGQEGRHWRDSPLYQRLKCDLLRETLAYWRDYDLSGMCPFAEAAYAFGTHAPRHTQYNAKRWPAPKADPRRFGWTPEMEKNPYQHDVNPALPLPTGAALRESFAPLFGFFDGGAAEPSDRCVHVAAGGTLAKRLVLINDTRAERTFEGTWTFGDRSGRFRLTLAPGGKGGVDLALAAPRVTSRTKVRLSAEVTAGEPVAVAPLEITVLPAPDVAGVGSVLLYDPVGRTAAKLRALGVPVAALRTARDYRDGLVVVGTEALDDGFAALAAETGLDRAVDEGRACVLVMAQKPEQLKRLGLRTEQVYARTVYDPKGRAIGPWAGKGLLAPDRPAPDPATEGGMPNRNFFHWSDVNIVSSYPVLRPSEGSCVARLVCGKDLVYAPLLELPSGRGRIVSCQLEIETRSAADPQADGLLVSLLRLYRKVVPAPTVADEIVHAARAGEFGVVATATNVTRLALAPAGASVFPAFSARDGYLRHPAAVSVFSGEGVVPLLEPAVAAMKVVDGKRHYFVGLPEDPEAEAIAAAVEKKRGPSVVWALEAQANRLRALAADVAYAAGRRPEKSLAARLAHPLEPKAKETYPYGHNTSTYGTETHIRW